MSPRSFDNRPTAANASGSEPSNVNRERGAGAAASARVDRAQLLNRASAHALGFVVRRFFQQTCLAVNPESTPILGERCHGVARRRGLRRAPFVHDSSVVVISTRSNLMGDQRIKRRDQPLVGGLRRVADDRPPLAPPADREPPLLLAHGKSPSAG